MQSRIGTRGGKGMSRGGRGGSRTGRGGGGTKGVNGGGIQKNSRGSCMCLYFNDCLVFQSVFLGYFLN